MGIEKAVAEWLKGYDGTLPKLTATGAEPGDVGLSVVQSDYVLRRFIDGSVDHRAAFMVSFCADWSGGTDSVNADAADYGAGLLEWVAAQWPGNPPDIGHEVLSIEPRYNAPTAAIVDQANAVAKYQFSFEIDYRV